MMKFFMLFMLLTALQVNAVVKSQETLLNVNVARVSLVEVLKMIESKSDYTCLYSHEDVAKVDNLTVELKNATVREILDVCLKGTRLGYKIVDQTIVIRNLSEMEQKNGEIKQRTITGKVTDKSGAPLPGVTVMIKGLSVGTATDVTGSYKLAIPQEEKDFILQFSFVGMKTQEVKYVGKDTINVVLEEEVNTMDEVVITGYQRIDKRKNASSVISVKGSELQEGAAISIDNMLQGKLAGVNIINPTSTPGAAPKVRIRGASSISGNREPVWVVDGIILEDPVPISAEELNSLDNVNLIGNAIASINPEDIDRIDVLKDASATAIYGVKAANGVIVITTKKGKYGKPSVHYSGNVGISLRPSYNNLNRMNSKERIDVSKEIEERGLTFGIKPSNIGYEGALYDLYAKRITQEQFVDRVYDLEKVNTDWYDELFRTDVSHKHSLSISGGSEFVNYYFSAGYANTNAVVKGSDVESCNALLKLNLELSKKLNVGLSLRAYAATKKYLHGSIDPYGYAYNTSRAIPAYNEDGTLAYYAMKEGEYGSDYLMSNVINELNETGSKNRTNSLNVSMNLSSKLTDWLSWDAVVGYNTSAYKQNNWATDKSYKVSALRRTAYGYEPQGDDLKDFKSHSSLPFGGILDEDYTNNTSYTVRTSLSFNKLWNDHSVSASAGLEVRGSKYDGTNSESYGYLHDRGKKFIGIDPVDYTGYANYSKSNVPTVMDNTTNNMSYYATFAYGFRGRYVLSANVRGDASNKLGQDKSARFLPIWSFSGRWNVADESFMQNVNWVNDLSFRASYGLQGNVTDAHNPNMIISLGSLDTKSMQYIATLSSLPNPGLKWEKTTSINLGLDFSLFKGAISATVEYYTKKGKDQLISASVPSTNGATSVMLNAGTMSNKGWELSIMATPVKTKDFAWSVSFNTSKNYNKVTNSEYESVETYNNYINGSLIRNGKSINSFYSYRYTGLDESGLPTFAGVRATDDEGNVIISSREEALAAAFVYSGKREQDFTGGLSMNFKCKSISLNTLFAMSLGANVRLNDLYQESGGRIPYPESNMSSEFVNRWKEPGDEKYTDIPVLTDVSPSINSYAYLEGGTNVIASNIWQMYNKSDLRVVDGSFLRCKSISLTYSLPKSFLSKCYIKSASIGLGVSNPFVIKSKDLKGRDPEQSTLGSGAIPPQSTYSFSLNVSF